MLCLLGFAVVEAANGTAAYALFCESPFDFLITDISMPEMDGVELGRLVKQRCPDFPILYISGYTDLLVPKRRNTKFLQKPFTSVQIQKALKKLLPCKGVS